MNYSEENLMKAAAYLRDNATLRAAVGARPGGTLEPSYLGAGEHNLNFRFDVPEGGAFVLRMNVVSQPFHDNQVAYEYEALRALEPSGRVPRAVYLDDSDRDFAKGALVIEFREGAELDFDHLRPGDLRCAAQLMADVHAVEVAPDCTLFRPHDPLRSLFDECLERFRIYRTSAYEDARITQWVEKFIAACEPLLDTPFAASDCTHIVNTETLPSHFLIPAASAASAAQAGSAGVFCDDPGSFIDWERPIIGEVAQDVAYFTCPTTTFWDSDFLFPADSVEQFVDDYWRAVDDRFERGSFDARFKAYRALTTLRSVTWCCKALLQYGDLLAAQGAAHTDAYTTDKTLRKLPVYLSDDFMDLIARECFR